MIQKYNLGIYERRHRRLFINRQCFQLKRIIVSFVVLVIFFVKLKNIKTMGKGDKKSRRGKITNKSYGVRRRKDSHLGIVKAVAVPPPVPEEKVKPVKTAKPEKTEKTEKPVKTVKVEKVEKTAKPKAPKKKEE